LSLVDTNILVYSVLRDSEKHLPARRLLEQANSAVAGLCVCSQVLAEFFAVVTDPRRVSTVREPEEALAVIDTILTLGHGSFTHTCGDGSELARVGAAGAG
ncbi:MAG: PIN domain-containing protein, partial [Acidobacteriota bacterium]